MLKGRKSTRPEITVIGARPMSDSPFVVDATRRLHSPNDFRELYHTPNNGLDCLITRTSTLPTSRSHDKKDRPKSEIFNGFASLRPARIANGERGQPQKESSRKVVRSKSLHAPKKPPRNFSTRPTSALPCGEMKEDLPMASHLTSITPSRPAPPVPSAVFNKKNQSSSKQTAISNDASYQIEDKRAKNKRSRSRSASVFNDSQKSRVKVELPRGKSFNTHAPRQIIKTTQDENVVILARTIDDGHEPNVKLKSFGVKSSRAANNSSCSRETAPKCNKPIEIPNSNDRNSDKLPQNALANGNCNGKEAMGRISLSDAIHANAVYTRLQQKKEKDTDFEEQNGNCIKDDNRDSSANGKVRSDSICSNTSVPTTSNYKEEEITGEGLSLSEVDRRKKDSTTHDKSEQIDIIEKQGSNIKMQKTSRSGTRVDEIENESHHRKDDYEIDNSIKAEKNSSSGDTPKPVASYVVKTVVSNPQNRASASLSVTGRSTSLDGGNKKGSPPAVKPKPMMPKRPTLESIARLHGSQNEEETITSIEDAKIESPSLVVSSKVSVVAETSMNACEIVGQSQTVEKDSEKLATQGDSDTSKNSENCTIGVRKENESNMNEEHVVENFKRKDTDPSVGSSTSSGNGFLNDDDLVKNSSTHVQNASEDDVFHESSAQPRNRSESEAESIGSIDSLTSLTSQVTVIFNPETKDTRKPPSVTNDKTIPGPFESHETNRRRKSTPAPYSSHPGRRPKPGKAPPHSSTLKPKPRKSKSLYGRRLNASPPSTPPPPPKIDHSEPSPPVDRNKSRPPVPPRAPSMYIQNDLALTDITSQVKTPPPRPSKPPVFKDTQNSERKKSFDMIKQKFADAAVGKGSAIPSDSDIDRKGHLEESPHSVPHESSKFVTKAETLAEVDLKQHRTNTNSFQPNKDFSKKLEYFKDAIEKPKRPQPKTLCKQKSLDSSQGKVSTAQADRLPPNTVQLRKEGEDALRAVSRLKKENGDVIVNKRKSPAPQKPKRPSSVNMDSVVIFDINEVRKDVEVDTPSIGGKSRGRMPPAKPERSPLTYKSNTFERKKMESSNIQTGAKEKILEEVSADVELRSVDSELNENLKLTENLADSKKTVPKKPVRTSSLRGKNPSPLKIEARGEPTVHVVNEESRSRENGDICFNSDIKHAENTIDARKLVDSASNGPTLIDKRLEGDKDRCNDKVAENEVLEQITDVKLGSSQEVSGLVVVPHDSSATGCVSDTTQNTVVNQKHSVKCEVKSKDNNGCDNMADNSEGNDAKNERKSSSPESVSSGSCKSSLSEALSTQIDQLDRIMVETSTVLNEGLSDSFYNVDDTVERITPKTEDRNENGEVNDKKCSDFSISDTFQSDNNDSNGPSKTGVEILPDFDLKLKKNNEEDEDSVKSEEVVKKDINDIANSSEDNMKDILHQEIKLGKNFPQSSSQDIGKNTNTAFLPNTKDIEGVKLIEPCVGDPPNIDSRLDSQPQCTKKPEKFIPTKPARPKSFCKVSNIDFDFKTDSTIFKVSDTPSRAPELSLENESLALQTECKEILRPSINRANSAPERPCLSYTPRKSRPPIPSILREKKSENSTDESNDIKNTQNLQKTMGVTESSEIALCYASENKINLSLKSPKHEDQLMLSEMPAALAIYPFVAGSDGELTFDSGDTIELLSKKSEDWFIGRCNEREGSFPASFVAIMNPLKEDGDYSGISVPIAQPASIEGLSKVDSTNKVDSSSERDQKLEEIEGPPGTSNMECVCAVADDYPNGAVEDLGSNCKQGILNDSKPNDKLLKGRSEEKTKIIPKELAKIE